MSESSTILPGPRLSDRLFRLAGHMPIPRIEALAHRLGAFRNLTPRTFTARFDRLRYIGRLDQHIDRNIYLFGAYSHAELDFLEKAARVLRCHRDGLVFADIGANVGQHSLFMSSRADTVIAFEPAAEAAQQFEDNLRLNGIKNVMLQRCALGREDSRGMLGSGLAGNSGSRSLVWSLDADRSIEVPIVQANRAIEAAGAARLDLVKIDVEGYEKEVLQGLAKTLERDRPIILFELIGKDLKGGFASEAELRNTLYPDHRLMALSGRRKAKLHDFDWSAEEVVCAPAELVDELTAVMR